jgi:hypothetical protein
VSPAMAEARRGNEARPGRQEPVIGDSMRKIFSKEKDASIYTVTFWDDEFERSFDSFEGCTNVESYYDYVSFTDKFGLKHVRSGCNYSMDEEIGVPA